MAKWFPCVSQRSTVTEYENQLDLELNQLMKEYFYKDIPTITDYIEPAYWCDISYYEFKDRVGESFKAIRNPISIDGFTDPASPDRFCLGGLMNPNRRTESERVVTCIGKGMKLFFVDGKDVYVDCCGQNAIFVQSLNANLRNDSPPGTVCKVPPGVHMNVFNTVDFASRLQQSVSKGYRSVEQMKFMCLIRVSFAKGWGEAYVRPYVTFTPCWIEIRLNRSIRWVDRVMKNMQPSSLELTETDT